MCGYPVVPLVNNRGEQLTESLVERCLFLGDFLGGGRANSRIGLACEQALVDGGCKGFDFVKNHFNSHPCSNVTTEIAFATMAIAHDGYSQSVVANCAEGGILTRLVVGLVAFSLAGEVITLIHQLSPIVNVLAAIYRGSGTGSFCTIDVLGGILYVLDNLILLGDVASRAALTAYL